MAISMGEGIGYQKERSLKKNLMVMGLALLGGAGEIYLLLTRYTSLPKLVILGMSAGFFITIGSGLLCQMLEVKSTFLWHGMFILSLLYSIAVLMVEFLLPVSFWLLLTTIFFGFVVTACVIVAIGSTEVIFKSLWRK